jgi:hypothetical protein
LKTSIFLFFYSTSNASRARRAYWTAPVGRTRRFLVRWPSPVLPFGPGFLVLRRAAPGRLRHDWFQAAGAFYVPGCSGRMRWPGRHTPLCVANQIKFDQDQPRTRNPAAAPAAAHPRNLFVRPDCLIIVFDQTHPNLVQNVRFESGLGGFRPPVRNAENSNPS